MASEVDDWPDHQIREKFDEFGISSPPVTGSTRKFLVKKLKNLMSNGGATPTKQVEEEPYEEEPDVPPLPPTRIPRRLGRSALSTLNDTQNVPSSAAHSPSLSPVKRSFSPGRSPARVPLASSIQDTERSTRSKSPGRLPPASSDENILPARKVTPGRRVPERESEPIFSSQLTSPNAYTSSPSNFELFKSRKSIERNKDVGNDTFRSRLLDSSTGDYESDFMKRLSNGASYLPKRQLDDEDLMWSDDETDLRDPLQFFSKTLGYEILSSNENRRYPLAIYLAFLAPFAILVTACAAYFKIAPLAEWIVTIGVTTIVAYLFYFAVQWRLAEKQKFTENVVSAFEKFVEMMKTGKFMKTKQAADELVAAGFSVDVITAVLKKATSDLRFKLYERDGITGYFWAAKGESSDKPGKFLLTGGGVGGHFVAPSSCLKIRGMFDPSSQIMNNQEIGRIVDAVLEECTGNMLVHVAVDPRSSDGVVYARGLLGADAAGVFRKINGSIFEGRRVTVKFIRPTRYNEKFPQSVSLTRPLRPSTRSY